MKLVRQTDKVSKNDKFNYINDHGNILFEEWFDCVGDFHGGFAWVKLNSKYNFITEAGTYFSDLWFDNAYSFYNGVARVKINNAYYELDNNGNLNLKNVLYTYNPMS